MKDILDATKEYITKLKILEVMTVFDLYEIMSPLKNIESLHLTLGRKKAGMDFEKSMTGMKLSDIENLANALHTLKNLVNCLVLLFSRNSSI